MLTANEIRDSFKSFFESKGHQIVPSAPMVIKDDPTLMFTNAGMNQFKDIILGNHPAKYKRVADSQKCLRVSGKHNDLEEVGHDTYHHTMFEMLGNWSFGDYFKKEAISWAWEYLVDVLKLDPKDLYATVFEGSPEEGLERDNEAASYWEQFLPKDHILNGNKHDNFWEMGDTGPCGPCSEIHVDSRSEEEKAKVPGSQLVNKDHPQVIEIWNLVFMQFNRKADGSLEGLPAKVIDTGIGFERLVRTLQGKTSNYDTDVFQPILKAIGDMAGKKYGEDEKSDIAMRVIADHIRTIAFSITDGQLPSNAKAGYVILSADFVLAGGFGICHGLFQQADTRLQGAEEGVFFFFDNFGNQVLLRIQLGVSAAHILDEHGEQLVHECLLLSEERVTDTESHRRHGRQEVRRR